VTASSSKRPHVGINAHLLTAEESYRQAGVSRYIHGLLTHLPEADPEGRYTLFLNPRCAFASPLRQKRARIPTTAPWVRILWEQAILPVVARMELLDLLHSPVNIQPLSLPCRGVVTITDLSFLIFPQKFGAMKGLYQKVLTKRSCTSADHLIAISRWTAADVQQRFHVPAQRISVVYPGVGENYHPIQQTNVLAFRSSHQLPERFMLFVGTLEPRKNLLVLLRAYAEFRRHSGADCKLVLVGGRGWLYEPILAAVEELGLVNDVIFPGFVAEAELPLWYNAAEAFLYPSLYEGFGLPPLEAMACGVPVVVSRASSLPEVVGDAGLLIDPERTGDWTEAMVRLATRPDLRHEFRSRGLVQAQRFSWQRAAEETVSVYRRTCSGGA
jgi:glycosyltransferase involved in cell wall biosynthesis